MWKPLAVHQVLVGSQGFFMLQRDIWRMASLWRGGRYRGLCAMGDWMIILAMDDKASVACVGTADRAAMCVGGGYGRLAMHYCGAIYGGIGKYPTQALLTQLGSAPGRRVHKPCGQAAQHRQAGFIRLMPAARAHMAWPLL